MREGISDIGGRLRGPNALVQDLIKRSSTMYPESSGGGAMAMDSVGYQKRESTA